MACCPSPRFTIARILCNSLIDLGFDPNERTRMEDVDADGIAFTWGMPLYHCAQSGKYEMAEMLLKHGADPNGKVYASGDPVFQAYDKRDWKMVELLERYGGVPEATTAGLFRQTELARRMLAGEKQSTGAKASAAIRLPSSCCGAAPAAAMPRLYAWHWSASIGRRTTRGGSTSWSSRSECGATEAPNSTV